MATIIETPQSLCRRARQATEDNRDVMLDPGIVRSIAELWHADQEKIRYLESLIVRVGRPQESTVTLKCKVDCSDLDRLIGSLNASRPAV
jgi:hypothetical protein